MSATTQQMQTLLAMARRDRMVSVLEQMYRDNEDQREGALCLAVVIQQAAERFGSTVDMDAMADVILADWAGGGA